MELRPGNVICVVIIFFSVFSGLRAQRCHVGCQPPDCSCPRMSYPMPTRDIPQMVYFGFDDAVNIVMSSLYERIFTKSRKNPNGCRMKMSLFVSHQYTDYRKVKQFYDLGNEIGVHSVSHTVIDNDDLLRKEAKLQKENLARAGVPEEEIIGWRSPFLKTAGLNQPQILKELGYEYDISLTYTRPSMTSEKPWPFTMDNGWPYVCGVEPCPIGAHVEHFWSVPVVSLMDHKNKYACPFADGCAVPALDEKQSYDFLWKNFMSYYNSTRTPFGLNMHAAWFYRRHNLKAMMRFLDDLMNYDDVYVVTVKQMLDWMKQPTPIRDIDMLQSWQCAESRRGNRRQQRITRPKPRSNQVLVNFLDLFRGPSPLKKRKQENQRRTTVKRVWPIIWTSSPTRKVNTRTFTKRPRPTPPKMKTRKIPRPSAIKLTKPVTIPTTKPSTIKQTTTTTKQTTTKQTTTPSPTTTVSSTTTLRTSPSTTTLPSTTRTEPRVTTTIPTTSTVLSTKSSSQSPSTTTTSKTTLKPTTTETATTTTHPPSTSIQASKRPNEYEENTSKVVPNTPSPIVEMNKSTTTKANNKKAINQKLVSPGSQWSSVTSPSTKNTTSRNPKQTSSPSTNIQPVTARGLEASFGPPISDSVMNDVGSNNMADVSGIFQSVGTKLSMKDIITSSLIGGMSLLESITSLQDMFREAQPKQNLDIQHNHDHGHTHTNDRHHAHEPLVIVDLTHNDTTTQPTPRDTITFRSCIQGVTCHLPDCFCQGTSIPNNLKIEDTPQMIYITLEGSVNPRIYRRYQQIFKRRRNPNNCRATGTVFATDSGSSASAMRKLSALGADIAMQGLHEHHYDRIEHMEQEIIHQKLSLKESNVNKVKGWKTPELKALGNEQYRLLKKHGFQYDATLLTTLPRRGGSNPWPFTLDYGYQGDCVIPECPTQRFPGLWEVQAVPVIDYKHMYECSYVDGCMFNPPSANATEEFLWDNFMFNYKSNKAPFGIHLRHLWFSHHAYKPNVLGFKRFLDRVLALKDVFIVSIADVLEWIQNPTPVKSITGKIPWNCT